MQYFIFLLFLHITSNKIALSFLESVKQEVQEYFANRGTFRSHSTGSFNDLNKPRNLGLFFCITTKEELEQITDLLLIVRKQHPKVTALVFNYGYEPIDLITDKAIIEFDLNDFNFFGKTKEQLQKELLQQHFELLLNFTFEFNPLSMKIFSEIKADFKIGPFVEGYETLYDLTLIYKPDLFGIMGFYENIRHYLSVLNLSNPQSKPTVVENGLFGEETN
jgi:hypothetical protein